MIAQTLQEWSEAMADELGCDVSDVMQIARLDVVLQALLAADAVDVNGHEIYVAAPMKAAVLVGYLVRQPVLPYENLKCARRAGEDLLAKAGLELDLDKGAQRTCKRLMDKLKAGDRCEFELACFLAVNVVRRVPMADPDPVAIEVQVFMVSQVCRQEGDDQDILNSWSRFVDDGMMEGAEEAEVPIEIHTFYPAQVDATPKHVWESSRISVNRNSAGMVVLGQRGGATGVGFDLARMGRRRAILWLAHVDDPIPKLIEAAKRDYALTIERFSDPEEIKEIVAGWTIRNAKRLILADRELAEKRQVAHYEQIKLRRRWIVLNTREAMELSMRTGLTQRRIIDLLLDGDAYFDAPHSELSALAASLGTSLDEVAAPSTPLALSARQEEALRLYVREYRNRISAEQALHLRAQGEREIARIDCRWSLTVIQDWAELRASYEGSDENLL